MKTNKIMFRANLLLVFKLGRERNLCIIDWLTAILPSQYTVDPIDKDHIVWRTVMSKLKLQKIPINYIQLQLKYSL